MNWPTFSKKTIIIICIIGFLILVSIIVTAVRIAKNPNKSAKTSQLIKQKVLYPVISSDKQKLYFFSNSEDSAFYQSDTNGQNIKKISDNINLPDEVIWSPDQQQAILNVVYDRYSFERYGSVFSSPGTEDQTITHWLYDFTLKKLSRLDDHLQSIVWQKNKIIYEYLDDEKNIAYIAISNSGGSNSQKIVDLPSAQEYSLNLLNDTTLVVSALATDNSPSKNYLLDLSTKTLSEQKDILSMGKVISFANRYLLYDKFDQNNPHLLFAYDLQTKSAIDLKLTSAVDNLAFLDNTTLVLIDGENGKNILCKYDIAKNKVTKIGQLPQKNPFNLIVKNSNNIFYTDDNLLYQANLK